MYAEDKNTMIHHDVFKLPSGLFLDLYELTMGQVYFKEKPDTVGTFDLFIRSQKRPFYAVAGISEFLDYLEALAFTGADIDYLKSLNLFSKEYLSSLSGFKFNGEIYSVKDGEIVCASEPIMSVTAPLAAAQLIESAAINFINLYTTLLTKAARVIMAADARKVFDFSLRRTQGIHAACAAAKCAYLAGAEGTSNVLAGSIYNIPLVGTMAHSYVMSFASEAESFLKFSRYFPRGTILLVDTYDTGKGVAAAVEVGKRLQKEGLLLKGIRLDSGDLYKESIQARKILDQEGLIDTFIIASGDLDEYKIKKLVDAKAPIDAFGVGTHMGVASDYPFCDMIYKLVEFKEHAHQSIPTMKLSKDKVTLPGKKQVFRTFERNGYIKEDIIGLKHERIARSTPLLSLAFKDTARIYKKEALEGVRARVRENLGSLPPGMRQLSGTPCGLVHLSRELTKLVEQTKNDIRKHPQEGILFIDGDTQRDFMLPEGSLFIKDADRLLPRLAVLTRAAKQYDIPVISVVDTHIKNDKEFLQFPPHCVYRTKGWEKIPQTLIHTKKNIPHVSPTRRYEPDVLRRIVAAERQIIVEKGTFDIFTNPNFKPLLDIIAPLHVFVYGVATDYCVKFTVEGLLALGFKVHLVRDAIKEIDTKAAKKLLKEFIEKGVVFTTTKSVIAFVEKEKRKGGNNETKSVDNSHG